MGGGGKEKRVAVRSCNFRRSRMRVDGSVEMAKRDGTRKLSHV